MKSAVGETFGFSAASRPGGTPGLRRDRGERVAGRDRVGARGLGGRVRDDVRSATGCGRLPAACRAGAEDHDRDRRDEQEGGGRGDRPASCARRARLPARDGPYLLLQPRRLGAGGGAEVVARLAEGVDDRARRVDERARRAARERAGEIARPSRPARRRPGSSRIACGISLRASLTAAGGSRRRRRRPTRARARRRDRRPTRRRAARRAATSAAVGERHVLDVAARVRGLDDAEDAGAVAARRGEVRLDRLAPEPRVDGQRVGAGSSPSRYAAA